MNNRKAIIVAGSPLVGKTSYIMKNFEGKSDIFYFDFGSTYQNVTGDLDNFPESENLLDVYNTLSENLVDEILFGKKDIVFEFCLGYPEMDENLHELISVIKDSGTEVSLIQLTCDLDIMKQRSEAVKRDANYISSYHLNEHTFDILSNFFEDLKVNNSIES